MILNRLFLVGMPGAGKTTLGHALAARYALPFLDLDAEIVRREGRSIPDIFSKDGEEYFRQVEADALRATVAQHDKLVLATGGGTPCFHQNAVFLNQNGLALWLDVPIEVLLERVQRAAASRPLLAAAGSAEQLEARLRETLAHRRQFYELAPLHFQVAACSPEAVHALLTRYLATG